MPGGAFYAFANVKATGRSSKEMADALLNEAGVACLDGGGFGEYRRRVCPVQLCEFVRESDEGGGADSGVE